METVTDIFLILGGYHIVLFSNFVTDVMFQFYAGFSFFILILVLILINVVKITIEVILKLIKTKKLKDIKESKLQRWNQFKEIINIKAKHIQEMKDREANNILRPEDPAVRRLMKQLNDAVVNKALKKANKVNMLKTIQEESKEEESI